MRYLSSSPYINYAGAIWEVNASDDFKICPKHLKGIIKQVNIMCSKYRRVFITVFDLHMDHYTDTNVTISAFQRKLFPRLKSKYKVTDIGFCWVREKEKAKQQHYHFALFMDGKQIRYPDTLLDIIKEKWMLAGGSHVYTPKNCYYMIEKNDFQVKQEVIYRLSYQAKERGKGYRAKQAKDYGMSRLTLMTKKSI